MTSELIQRAKNGDSAAFGQLVTQYQDLAVGTAVGWLGDIDAAHDVAQEAFFDAYRQLHQLREPAAFAGWLRRIVVKHCDRLTRRKSVTPPPEHAVDPGPELVADRDEVAGLLRAAVEALPEQQRIVVALHYFGDNSGPEIAAYLEIPESTVKKRLRQAREHLRKLGELPMPEQADQLRPSNSAVFAQEVIFYIALRAGNHDEVRRLIALNRELLDAPQDWSADLVYQGVLPFANKATPLITAIELNDLPMAELLLDAGADVNGICGCVTAEAPLWSAALFNRYNHARLLLEHGADPNVVSAAGNRPLHLAAMRGFTDIAELLLQHGANSELKDDINPGVRWFPTDNRAEVLPRTPAQWATEKEQRQRQHNRNRAADVIETGIKAIDLFAPIEHGAVIRVPFMAGVGMMVLLGELSRRFHDMDNGVAIWTGFTQPPFDLLDFEADVAELGLQKTILISLASFKERHEVRRSAFERGLVAAEALRDSGKRVLTIVLSAQGFESDIEAYLPRLKGTVTTIVVSPFADTSEVWDSLPPPYTAQITLDRERAKAHLFPAISPTGTLSNTLVSARHTRIASSARSALGKLSQAPQPLLAYLAQPFFTAEPFTGRPGEWVAVDDLLSDVEQLVEAEDV